MKTLFLGTLLIYINLYALTAKEFAQQQTKEFNSYKKSQLDAFTQYKKKATSSFSSI